MGVNNYEIRVAVKTDGEDDVQKLGRDLETLGKITAFKQLGEQINTANQKMIDAQMEADRLASELDATAKPTRTLVSQYEKAQANLDRMTKAQRDSVTAYKAAGLALTDLGVDIKNLDQETDALRQSSQKLKASISESMKLDQARGLLDVRPYKDVKAEIENLRAAYRHLADSGTLSQKELYKAQQQLKEKTRDLEESTNGWGKSITNVRTGLLALAAIGYTVTRSFAACTDFAQEMGKVNTMIDVSKDKFESLSGEIVAISTKVPQSAKDLAAAEYAILSSGVALSDSTRVLEQSAQAAVAGVTDTKTAVLAGVGVVNAYGMGIKNLGKVYDVMFQTVKAGQVEFQDLANFMGEITPAAVAAKVGFEDVSAAMATLTINGMKAPQAATAIKGAITAMAAPAPDAKKKFEELGITWKGFIPTLEQIKEKNLSLNQMRALIPDTEARTGVLSLMQNMGELNTILGQVNESSGSTREAFDKMKDTPANQIALLKNEIAALVMSMEGPLMKDGILPAVKGLALIVKGIHEADTVTKGTLGTIALVTAGYTAWKIGLAAVSFGLKGLGIDMRSTILSMQGMDLTAKGLTASFRTLGAAQKAAFAAAAIGAAYGVVEIGRLVVEIVRWRMAVSGANDAMDRLKQNATDTMDRFKGFKDVKVPADLTGKSKDDLAEMNQEIRSAIAYYTALNNDLYAKSQKTSLFGNMTDEAQDAKKKMEEVGRILQGLKSDYTRVRSAQGFPVVTTKSAASAEPVLDEDAIKKAGDDQKKLAKQLQDELVKISGDTYTVRINQAKAHYREELALAHGNGDLMKKAAQVYNAELAKIETDRNADEQKQATARIQAHVERMKSETEVSLEMLKDLYDDGNVTLANYYAERRRLMDEQFKAEQNALMKEAAGESDPSRKLAIENTLFKLEQTHKLELIRLTREETQAQEDLAAKKRDVEAILTGLRQRSGDVKTTQDQRELMDMDRSHEEEIKKLRDLYATKSQLDEAYRLQKAEKDKLIADQEKRTFELRLQTASGMAGDMATIFSNMYELTGKKHKEFFYLQKAAAIAQATINAYLAASKALAELPPPLSYGAAGVAVAMGMVQVAMITAQQLADGGRVNGTSPHDRADNIPAMLTAGEYVQPVSAVKYYGPGVMEALRQRRIPREAFAHVYNTVSDMSARVHLASGGPVVTSGDSSQGAGSGSGGQSVQITNILDPRLFEQYAASSDGQKAILNVISKNAFQVKRILSK